MRGFIALATLAIALVASATAQAGGWATVGLEPLPSGVGPGDTWHTEMTVLQHGVTPLEGLSPTITISSDDTGDSRQFTATATGKPGVYEADVVFPESGNWRIVADSTFGDSTLTYGPILVEGGSPGGADTSDFPVVPILVVLGGMALVAAAGFGVLRQRRLTPAG